MISREEAGKILEAAKLKNPNVVLAQRVQKLPKHLVQITLDYLCLDANGDELKFADYQVRNRFDEAAKKAFDQISSNDFALILEAWFPRFPKVALAALQTPVTYRFRSSVMPSLISQFETAKGWLAYTRAYDQPLEWMTEYAGYEWAFQYYTMPLFLAAVDTGNDAVFEIMLAAAKNEHPVAVMGDYVIDTLMRSKRPEGWELLEKLLLAAQRQEGLRQSIFNKIMIAHPMALKRMLHLILKEDLLRFSSSVQWAIGFLPLAPTEPTPKVLETTVRDFLTRLEDQDSNRKVAKDLKGTPDCRDLYLALYVLAVENLEEAQSLGLPWLKHKDAKYRFAALHVLQSFDLGNHPDVIALLNDTDDVLAIKARSVVILPRETPEQALAAFETLKKFLERFPAKLEVKAPELWMGAVATDPSEIAGGMFDYVNNENARLMMPYKHLLNPWTLRSLMDKLTEQKPWDGEVRGMVIEALTAKDNYLRERAFQVMQASKTALEESDFAPLEKQLSRKTASVRKDTIGLILAQPAELASASASRLKSAKTPEQKKAGEEIAKALESVRLEQNVPSAADGFGLFDPTKRTPAFPLERKNVQLVTPAALALLTSLEKLVWQHRLTIVDEINWNNDVSQKPFENAWLRAASPYDQEVPLLEQWKTFPLNEVWTAWFENRSAKERDADGLEILRAIAIRPFMFKSDIDDDDDYYDDDEFEYDLEPDNDDPGTLNLDLQKTYFGSLKPKKRKDEDQRLESNMMEILDWLKSLYPAATEHDFAFDVFEDQLAQSIPMLEQQFSGFVAKGAVLPDEVALKENKDYQAFKRLNPIVVKITPSAASLTSAQQTRAWKIEHSLGLRLWWNGSRTINHSHLMAAVTAGIANQTDVMEALIGPSNLRPTKNVACNNGFTDHLTQKPSPLVQANPQLQPLLEQCADRVLEIELQRGDLPTPATGAATRIRFLAGLPRLMQILKVIGQDNISRGGGYYYNDQTPRLVVFSDLLKAVYPSQADTQADFDKAIKQAKIPEQRLLELGLFAPQWTQFVAKNVAWKGLAEAMYWLRAHTKDGGFSNDSELEGWKLEMAQLTPLLTQDLVDGAVDVAWFNQVYKDLGDKRWTQLYDAAKYITSGTGHARAKQFADAMLGKLPEADVVKRITTKRHQDSVRALGLIPLPKAKEVVLLARYEVVQTFLKQSKQFGSQRKESERLASRIALENLARTAGFPDPMRLEWAMELKAVADLAKGAVKLKKDDVELVLSVTTDGEPQLEVLKASKTLKDIPANLKKDEAVIEIRARKKELENSRSRMRVSLERAMVHGDAFTAKELRDLTKHPIARPMLEQLVFIDGAQLGFLSPDGKNLVSANGELLEIKASSLRLAHPVDLFESKTWSEWQSAYFTTQRQQPFKQIFRELYLLTPAEKLEKTKSSRYAGHQINPRQSAALLGARGWIVRFDGDASRTFFAESLTAHISSKQGYSTPAEVEAPALETVSFSKRGGWEALDLESIPKRLYSEIMRDLDLVVSVAHVGGVDPEASQSTTEMRSALLEETLRLLKIGNVKLEKNVALIEGQIGRYSVHLGSAVVHQQPGGAICLVAVPNQARGRIFLPFADSDPRTAEVIAKVIMLAKDSEIQDPILLRQLVA
jgi:Family of unknown function (DUF5724)/Domain of unknown function (DUF4132)